MAKLMKVLLTMLFAIPMALITILAIAQINKMDAILYNQMVENGIPCDCTCHNGGTCCGENGI